MYLNKALIIGNLTRDPEMRSLPSGVKVTSFSLATNRVWKDKDGNILFYTDAPMSESELESGLELITSQIDG